MRTVREIKAEAFALQIKIDAVKKQRMTGSTPHCKETNAWVDEKLAQINKEVEKLQREANAAVVYENSQRRIARQFPTPVRSLEREVELACANALAKAGF